MAILPLLAIDNPTVTEIVGRKLDGHCVAGQDFNIVLADPPRNVTERLRAVLEPHTEHRVRIRL